MKKIQTILTVFVISLFISVFAAEAKGEYINFVNYTLPSYSGIKTTETRNKTLSGLQYVKTSSATASLTGTSRAVSAQVVGSKFFDFISAPVGSYVSWADSDTQKTGSYYLRLKATASTMNTVSYNGTWFLDRCLIYGC